MICIFLKNFSRLAEPALEIKPARPSDPPCPHIMPTIAVPTPYQLNTIATASSDFRTKSEDVAAMVGRWYGGGGVEREGDAPTYAMGPQHRLHLVK